MLKVIDVDNCIYMACPNPRRHPKQKIYGGNFFYLASYLFNLGYDILFDYSYAEEISDLRAEKVLKSEFAYLIVDLFRNELFDNDNIYELFEQIELIKKARREIKVVLIGSISSSVGVEHLKQYVALDSIVNEKGIHKSESRQLISKLEIDLFGFYNSNNVSLDFDFFDSFNFKPQENGLFLVASSWGCNNKCSFCSFCSYNMDTASWSGRDTLEFVDEIKKIKTKWGGRRISLTDSNFGNDCLINETRLLDIKKYFQRDDLDFDITLNISIDGLNERVIDLMSEIGVKTVLIGLESFNKDVLKKKFSKVVDFSHSKKMIEMLENKGVVAVISIILFHPWHTLISLIEEIRHIDDFGRSKFIHYAANSFLRVIPGTVMEKRLAKESLLVEDGLNLSFKFLDKNVEHIYFSIKKYTEARLKLCNSFRDYTQLKIDEWNSLKSLCNDKLLISAL